jgi:hypothetical protein
MGYFGHLAEITVCGDVSTYFDMVLAGDVVSVFGFVIGMIRRVFA